MVCGSQTTEPYSTVDLTRAKYATSLHCFGQYLRLRFKKFARLFICVLDGVAEVLTQFKHRVKPIFSLHWSKTTLHTDTGPTRTTRRLAQKTKNTFTMTSRKQHFTRSLIEHRRLVSACGSQRRKIAYTQNVSSKQKKMLPPWLNTACLAIYTDRQTTEWHQ